MRKTKRVLAFFLALLIGLHPILVSAANEEIMPVENEVVVDEEVVGEGIVQEESAGIGEETADGGSVSEEIVEIPGGEEEPRAASSIFSNISYSPVTGNASVASLPEGNTFFAVGDTVYFNMHITKDIRAAGAILTIYKDGSQCASYTHRKNYFQYYAHPYTISSPGSYSYKWTVAGVTPNGEIWAVEVSDNFNVPELTLDTADISLDMFGTKSKTIGCTVRNVQEKCTLALESSNSGVSCSWGQWEGYTIPLTITADSVGTTSVNVLLKRISDNKIFDKKTVNVVVKDSTPAYIVSFDANGGSVSPISKSVAYGGEYGTLPVPTRENYDFDGWYTQKDGGTKVAESSKVQTEADHTLYAHWIGKSCTVYFLANGGSVTPDSKTVTYGSEYGTLPVPARENYDFDGWYTAEGTKVTSSSIVQIEQSHFLYAHWTAPRTYTVHFDANGGNVTPLSKTVTYGSTYGTLPTPIRKGYGMAEPQTEREYYFAGWYTEKNGGTKITSGSTVQVTSDQTLYARWYCVVFFFADGNESLEHKTLIYGNEYGTLPTPTWTGHRFDGWYTQEQGGIRITSNSIVETKWDLIPSAHVLYAHWTPTGKTYVATFDANGGEMSPASKTVVYASTYGYLPTPTRTGYDLDGWYTAKSGGVKITSGSTVQITSDQTFYAHWKARTYTVSFDANGGNVSQDSKTVTYGSAYGTLPVPTRENYDFDGWYTQKDGGKKITDSSTVQTNENQTLYAHWTEISPQGYLVNFDANGGEVLIRSKMVVYDSIYGFLPTPEWEGHAFDGWYTAKSGGTKIVSISRVRLTESHTLYARWVESPEKSYTVKFDANGGIVTPVSKTVVYGETYGTLPTPTRKEYAFDGWYTVKSGGTLIASDSRVELTEDQTLYAHWTWKIVPPTVTTNKASNVNKNTATLTGAVNDNGGDANLTRQFVYWNKYDSLSRYTISAGQDFKAAIKNLAPSSTYYYYAKALNKAGEGMGNVLSLTTAKEETPVSISVSPTFLSMEKGDTHQLLATILPADAANRKVRWSSSDSSIVTVDASGKLEAKKSGKATITVTAEANSRLSAACTVEVQKESLPDIKGAFDFSEWNMVSNATSRAPDGFDYEEKGDYLMSTAYLARWDGAVMEEKDPFPEYPKGTYRELDADYHVQEVLWIPARTSWSDNSEIKAAVMNYGAVFESFLINWSCFDAAEENYYAPESISDWNGGGHSVAVVGWDDDYPRSNFTKTPPGNGAFICKNSWGKNSGENGYFYISYYDQTFGKCCNGGAVVPSIEHKTNYNTIYQYDPLGACTAMGYTNASTVFAANVFPQKGDSLKKDEALRAVSFYTYDKNTSYEVYAVTDYKDSSSLRAKGTALASGSIKDIGYHTVPLNKSVLLKKGTRFAVIVKLSVGSGTSWVYYEYPLDGRSSKARANADESYYSAKGTQWNDLTEYTRNANFCIKAFTDNGTASYSTQLFEGVEEQARVYEDEKVYTLEEALASGIPVNEEFIKWKTEPRAGSDGEGSDMALGAVPPVIDIGENTVSFVEGAILPSTYDLRRENCVTRVQNQGGYGACWTFATYASLESCLLKKARSLPSLQMTGGAVLDAIADVSQGGIPATGIKLSSAAITLKKDATHNLTATFEPANTTENTVIWSSGNDAVATVDTNGMVTAHKSGTAVVRATSLDGSVSAECAVTVQEEKLPVSIKDAKFSGVKSAYTYTGRKLTPAPIVELTDKTLKKNTDYTVSYRNNQNVGTATVTIQGRGGYSGTKIVTFRIDPKGTSLSKLTGGKKQIGVKWKKQAVQTTGYEIQTSTSKKFAKGTTKLTIVKKASAVSTAITKLKVKTRYYVRIRTYKTVSGKKYYSGWSKTVSMRIK